MSKHFPNVFSFRLSNEDAEKYAWLIQYFHLDHRAEKSATFRYLVRELYKTLRARSQSSQLPSVYAANPITLSEAQVPGIAELEEEEERSPYDEDPDENQDDIPNYSELREIAVDRLMDKGMPLYDRHILAEIEAIIDEKKKLAEAAPVP